MEGICSQEQIGAREEIIKLYSVTRCQDPPFTLLCATGGRSIWIALPGLCLLTFCCVWHQLRSEGGLESEVGVFIPRLSSDGPVLAAAASR